MLPKWPYNFSITSSVPLRSRLWSLYRCIPQLLEAFIPETACLLNLSVTLSIGEIFWFELAGGIRNRFHDVFRCARWYDVRELRAHILLSHPAQLLRCYILLKTAKIHFATQKVCHELFSMLKCVQTSYPALPVPLQWGRGSYMAVLPLRILSIPITHSNAAYHVF